MSILHSTLEHACMCYPAYFHARKTLKFNYAIACTKFLAVKLQCLLAPRCQASVANLNEDIQRYIDLSVANLQCRRKTIYCLLQSIPATASGTVLTTACK